MQHKEVTCIRCGHIWFAQVENPKRCSRCHSLYWNRPRKYKQHKNKTTVWNKPPINREPLAKETEELAKDLEEIQEETEEHTNRKEEKGGLDFE